MKLLLTGANGFIGSHCMHDLTKHDITPLSIREISPEITDLQGYDAIIHMAALVHQMKGAPAIDYFHINYDQTLALAQKAKAAGVKQFIFISTIKVYGEETTTIPLNEASTCHPNDPYGQSKLAAENDLLKIVSDDFTVSILRIPLVYGEGVKANMLNLIKLCDKSPILPFGNIQNHRSILYVKNLTAFIHALLIQNTGGIYILADKRSISTTDLIKAIAGALKKNVYLFTIPKGIIFAIQQFSPSLHQRLFGSLELDPTTSFKKLNFIPPFSTQEGIDATIQWYLHD